MRAPKIKKVLGCWSSNFCNWEALCAGVVGSMFKLVGLGFWSEDDRPMDIVVKSLEMGGLSSEIQSVDLEHPQKSHQLLQLHFSCY